MSVTHLNPGSVTSMMLLLMQVARHEDCRTGTDRQIALDALGRLETELEQVWRRVRTTRPQNAGEAA